MELFEGVKRGAKRAGFEAERVMRIERTQGQIGTLNGQLRAGIARLGARAYELAQRGDTLPAELRPLCAELDALRAQIAMLEAEIESARTQDFSVTTGGWRCHSCGTAGTAGSHFCAKCGTPRAPTAPVVPAGGPVCPRCATRAAPGAQFCVRCGQGFTADSSPQTKASVAYGASTSTAVTPPSSLHLSANPA